MSTLSGLSVYASQQALIGLLPNGTNRWVGLVTALPTDRDGTGLVEATGSGYARVPIAAWVNVTDGTDVYRTNDGVVLFAALTDDLPGIVGWALWDDDGSPSGNLIAFGPTVDTDETNLTINYIEGEEPEITDQQLRVIIGVP